MPPQNFFAPQFFPSQMWWNSSTSLRERSAGPARHCCQQRSVRRTLNRLRILHSGQPKCASLRKVRWKRQSKPQINVSRLPRASPRLSRRLTRPQVRCGLHLKCGHCRRNGRRRCFRHHATHRPRRHVARTRAAARDQAQLRKQLRMKFSGRSNGLHFDVGPAVSCPYPLDVGDDRSGLSPAL